MEYERIDKVQTGIISPSKLRMKLTGAHHPRKKDGSNSNSSRTSPSKLQDSDFVKNSLLASKIEDYDEEVPGLQPSSVTLCSQAVSTSMQSDQNHWSKDNGHANRVKVAQSSRGDGSNSSTVHPSKSLEDENLDYDSNASSSSFEFHKGERVMSKLLTRSLSRPTSYKWNEAEKWIMNKQSVLPSYSRGYNAENQANRLPILNIVGVAPEMTSYDYRLPSRVADTKRVDFCQPTTQMGLDKSSFTHPVALPVSFQSDGANASIDLYPQSKDLKEVGQENNLTVDATGTAAIRAVSMRDMGTEMTPTTSQEPSRTATPVGATTPLRSPTPSTPSTPKRGAPASSAMDQMVDIDSHDPMDNGRKELSEQELKLKTRREIVALGVQLGKMNIAAWASKDEKEISSTPAETTDPEEPEHIEFAKRAAAWEEAEKAKHAARFKRDEIKIQAWESHQKAKLEAEKKRMEAKVERLRSYAEVKMKKKISMARKQSEEKRAAAEAKKNRQAEKTALQAKYIRETGRIPSSDYMCCGLFL
ncbi:hypothetical protein Nepgr_003300 [Nepenthes gracilis]|uniref:Remorin C-terminal domain-containing protein n=1 Tax=Nepenthes gracilis TaxID=150966 RepID=A0AAD3RZ84_NEPGR|nr:hypothetical protein Nepgr_003300 [Nepenthes gracilis]